MEGQAAIKYGLHDDLSEQELVDCAESAGHGGCKGGYMTDGFQYVKFHGIATSKNYPYIATRRTCSNDTEKSVIKVTGYKNVTASETVLQAAVGKPNFQIFTMAKNRIL